MSEIFLPGGGKLGVYEPRHPRPKAALARRKAAAARPKAPAARPRRKKA